jgi:hypothetical protein
VTVSEATVPVPDAVDLGLPSGLKWASFNLGATNPEEYGDYYAWGETEPYYELGHAQSENPVWKPGKEAGYDWSTYKWCMGSKNTLTKYCSNSSYGYNGFWDTKTVLDLEDDAAHVNLGSSWRMPTDAEFTELRENCTWEWTSMNGINGQKVTGPNGNSIFLPAAWYRAYSYPPGTGSSGQYWSSSLYTSHSPYARNTGFSSGNVGRAGHDRCDGLSIRPVTE